MQRVEAEMAVSVSDLKKNPTAIVEDARGAAVAVLNHNRVMAYMVPAATYEAMIDALDDRALVEIAKARAGERGVLADDEILQDSFDQTEEYEAWQSAAETYIESAYQLRHAEAYCDRHAPVVLHLASLGIELLLKANLISKGRSIKDIKRQKHRIYALYIDDENVEIRTNIRKYANLVYKNGRIPSDNLVEYNNDAVRYFEDKLKFLEFIHSSRKSPLRYPDQTTQSIPNARFFVDVLHAVINEGYISDMDDNSSRK
ncbi:type II toxin-antitoxin system Phd/YefM family antitoxin [Ancylobacter radicis]|uniref:Type II toxin-antitoxin system Phd/YefM family antitoxin n=1 Tax=Ancylobacter radicis TaxID=2836179 RepID=A0ABS5RA64_9HYPH|nr:type II toxin-antitoxin system Phd/YefM family antitoxin [Ancylobacter radicis]MBS9477237.1 type II toxin-antitoxin system Phd/YefM family antitoxin [Ancylobacter radicis]